MHHNDWDRHYCCAYNKKVFLDKNFNFDQASMSAYDPKHRAVAACAGRSNLVHINAKLPTISVPRTSRRKMPEVDADAYLDAAATLRIVSIAPIAVIIARLPQLTAPPPPPPNLPLTPSSGYILAGSLCGLSQVLFLRMRYLSRASTRMLVEVQEKDLLLLDRHLANSCTIPRQRSLSSFRTSPGSDISFSGNANRSTRVLQLPLGPPCGFSVVVAAVVRRFE